MSAILEPPVNDLWTIPGEDQKLKDWVEEDRNFFNSINPVEYYHTIQIKDFIDAVKEGQKPMITGEEGRATVALFTAIYRSQRDGLPVSFPLQPEYGRTDYDGRI